MKASDENNGNTNISNANVKRKTIGAVWCQDEYEKICQSLDSSKIKLYIKWLNSFIETTI